MAPNSRINVRTIHRGPRRWPHLSTETVTVQAVTQPSRPSSTTLIVSLLSLVGLLVSAVVYLGIASSGAGGASTFLVGFLAISGLTMIGSLITYGMQSSAARGNAKELTALYRDYLRQTDQRLAQLAIIETQARQLNDPPMSMILQQVAQQPNIIWQRRPSDPDFLEIRIGVGTAAPRFTVRAADAGTTLALPPKDATFRQLREDAEKLVLRYQTLQDVPITVALTEHSAVAITSASTNVRDATNVAKALVSQIALHHSPQEAHVIVLAPERSFEDWNWIATLPYTSSQLQTLGVTPADRERVLSLLLAELVRRENASTERGGYERLRAIPMPRLIIIVDAFLSTDSVSPLNTPALSLALRHGKELGVTVVCACAAASQAPAQATLLIEAQGSNTTLTAITPDPPAPRICSRLDFASVAEYSQLGQSLRYFRPEEEASLTAPSQVQLLPLITPPIGDLGAYDIRRQWADRAKGATTSQSSPQGKSPFSIPIGQLVGEETLTLDFVNDGPHGLLIGQTGSGKSELLRSIVAALALRYSPDEVNFVLVDYKAGLALEAFERLPHTVAFLTNMAQAGQSTRFLKMLEAEIVRRQRAPAGTRLPRLFVVIDEFAEMVNRKAPSENTDSIIDNLLSIVRLGRELDVHLLFASQRPEGSVIQRLRGYVQYRICLRTNTEEDSREILGRPDAAELPSGIPGRGYLLRGDNDLSLFQAARIATPYEKDRPVAGQKRRTLDQVLTDRMRELRPSYNVKVWPKALPTPSFDNASPLVLFPSGAQAPGTEVWDQSRSAQLQPMIVPLGMFDRPIEQKQSWCAADFVGYQGPLYGGPLVVMGDLNSGKTTTLQSLLLYVTSVWSPDELRLFVLDPTNALADFGALPHVRDCLDPERSNLIDGADDGAFTDFKARFERAFKAEERPRLLLVVDDFDELSARFKGRLQEMAQAAIRGRDRRVYLALSATRVSFDGLTQAMLNSIPTRVALFMNDKDQLRNIVGVRLPFLPDPIPGRGFIQTRRTLDEVQIAAPVDGASDEERLARLQAAIMGAAARWTPKPLAVPSANTQQSILVDPLAITQHHSLPNAPDVTQRGE